MWNPSPTNKTRSEEGEYSLVLLVLTILSPGMITTKSNGSSEAGGDT